MSESYAAYRSTNKNKNDKESKNTGLRKLAAGLALASLGVVGGGYVHDKLQSPEPIAVAAAEQQPTIDANMEDQLLLLQAAHDGDNSIAPHDVQLADSWKFIGEYKVVISKGGDIIDDALAGYMTAHGLKDKSDIQSSITDSINYTGQKYEDRAHERVHEGDELALSEVEDANGTTWAVVSGPVHYDTN